MARRQREPSSQKNAEQLVAALAAAFQAQAWDEAKRLLKANPSIIDPEVGASIGRALAEEPEPQTPLPATRRTRKTSKKSQTRPVRGTSASDLLSESERQFIAWMDSAAEDALETEYRSLFARCLEVGVDGAFWEVGKTETGVHEIQRLRDAAESIHLFDDAIEELDEDQVPPALEDWRQMASHPQLAAAPLPLQQQILGELAELISLQLRFTSSVELAREGVEVCERLVATNDEGSVALSDHLVTLGNACRTVFEITGGLDALDKAVMAYKDAISASRDRRTSAALWSLGTTLAIRYEYSRSITDLDEAIAALEAASPDRVARDTNNLAIALMHRYERIGSRRDLDHAIDLLTAQLKWSRSSDTLNNLATALFSRYERSHADADRKRAHRSLQDALAATSLESPDRPGRLSNLLRVLIRSPQSRRASNEARRIVAEIQALPVDINPSGVVAALRAWGEWSALRNDWQDAAVAFERGLRVLEASVQHQSSASSKGDWIRHANGIAMDAAYAHAKQGDLAAAVLAFERGRAVLLREELNRAYGDAAAHVSSFDDVQRAAAKLPLAFLAARQWGGFAIVVRAQSPAEILWLPKLTGSALSVRVRRYLAAYSRRAASAQDWDAAIVGMTRWLWQVAMGKLVSASPGPRMVMVAAGSLGILPLHAAWKADVSTPTRKRYVLDSIALTYVPSVASLLFARNQAATATMSGIVGVADPHAPGQPRLPEAVKEVKAVARHFQRRTVLSRRDATRDRVLQALREHDVWHFACHGFAAYNMAETGLLLANDEMLTIRALAELGSIGAHVRMAVLSACETAVMDGSVPDEAISLPAAMMSAGVASTIGSLWSVAAGASTAVLFARFYELWRDEKLNPDEALRDAQRWTRDSTNGEKHARYPRLVAPGAHIAKDDVDTWAKAKPHREPYFWAPFTYMGA